MPTISILSSTGGPTIHDVTDIMDDVDAELLGEAEDENGVVEAAESPVSPSQVLRETLVADELSSDLPVEEEATAAVTEDLPIDEANLAEELSRLIVIMLRNLVSRSNSCFFL